MYDITFIWYSLVRIYNHLGYYIPFWRLVPCNLANPWLGKMHTRVLTSSTSKMQLKLITFAIFLIGWSIYSTDIYFSINIISRSKTYQIRITLAFSQILPRITWKICNISLFKYLWYSMAHEHIMYKCQFRLLKTLNKLILPFFFYKFKYMYGLINKNAIIVLKKDDVCHIK